MNDLKISGTGALPHQMIFEMMENKYIVNAFHDNISPASLDLSISNEVYRVSGLFLPTKNINIRQLLKQPHIDATIFSLENILEKNVVYCARLNEFLELPSNIYAHSNPKSSTGRNDVHVRLLVDNTSRYDTIPKGYKGEVWALIIPKTFPIRLQTNETLNQIRFYNGTSRLTEDNIKEFWDSTKPIWSTENKPYEYEEITLKDHDGTIILTVDIKQEIPGWESFGTDRIIDFTKGRHSHNHNLYFRRLSRHENYAYLKKGGFYILTTHQKVRVSPEYSCEMIPIDEKTGEFRSHYAGFIDPGWGWGNEGNGTGRQLTLEIRPFEDMIIHHGQPIAKISFDKNASSPKINYDQKSTSTYTTQHGPILSKHFQNTINS